MISFYFSPSRGVTEWNRSKFLHLVNKVPTLRHYICEKSFLEKVSTKLGLKTNIFHRKLDIDFLIRFEQLDDDFKVVCEKLDIPHIVLPKRNSSTRKHYSKYYDNELKEIIRNKFLEEIEFGNYSFENC